MIECEREYGCALHDVALGQATFRRGSNVTHGPSSEPCATFPSQLSPHWNRDGIYTRSDQSIRLFLEHRNIKHRNRTNT